MTNKGKKTYTMWQMSWKQIINSLGLIILSQVLLLGCSSVQAIQYQDNQSDHVMLHKIEQQYQAWHKAPYRYGGNSLKGIDCSGLVMNFYHEKLNKSLPRVTAEQAKFGKNVSQLKAGDLVFFETGRGKTGLHVGIYYKNGDFLHASTAKGVKLSNLNEPYWKERYQQAKRIID